MLRKEDCFAWPVYWKTKILLLLLDMPFCALRMDKNMREQSYLWTMFKHLKLLSFSPSVRQASSGTSGIVFKQRQPPKRLRVKVSVATRERGFCLLLSLLKAKFCMGRYVCIWYIYIYIYNVFRNYSWRYPVPNCLWGLDLW